MTLHSTAQDVLDSIRVFDEAVDGPSGDRELDAAIAMRDHILDYLRSNPEGLTGVADLVDAFEKEQDPDAVSAASGDRGSEGGEFEDRCHNCGRIWGECSCGPIAVCGDVVTGGQEICSEQGVPSLTENAGTEAPHRGMSE